MNQRTNRSYQTSTTNKLSLKRNSFVGIVVDVILNKDNKHVKDSDSEIYSTGKNTSVIGYCVIRESSNVIASEENLPIFPPLDPLNLDIPLIGETVELVKIGNNVYYRRLNAGTLNRGNATENYNRTVYPTVDKPDNNAKSYKNTSQTGIVNNKDSGDRDTKIGENYKETQTNRLQLYEGDKIIQSRYGQSIRFSGYNNTDNEFSPTILIRNRQNDVSIEELEAGDITEEDINRDGSTIAITSGKYKIPFQPGTVDDGGSTNFETKPEYFENYPEELVGNDQILINSERIILSAKSKEMIFYSKGNWGFISDGKMSIDNGKAGAALNFNGEVKITTNDFNTYMDNGGANFYLNTDNTDEPLVRGNTLKDLLERILDLIMQQIYQTPSGPTAEGPTNKGEFRKIRSELDTFLSEYNFTDSQGNTED